jgi:Outer membrane protein beta-barrel domain
MKKLLFLITLSLIFLSAHSQFKVGVHGGLVVSKALVKNTSDQIATEYKLGPMAGLVFGLELGDSQFSLLSELNFFSKGLRFVGRQEFLGQQLATKGKSYIYYIEVPVQLLYYTDLGDGHFFFGAGPYIAAGIQGKTKTTFTINGEAAVEDTKTEFGSGYDQIKRYDYGVNGLIGYKLGYGSYLKLYYSHGIANLSNSAESEYSNRCVGITFGYFFGSGR